MFHRILGIDPGLTATGWGIIEKQHNILKYVASGVVQGKAVNDGKTQAEKQESVHNRITNIFLLISDIINQYKPTTAAIENTYVNINQQSSLKLAHARAASIIACGSARLQISEYQAKTIKKILVGSGGAEKSQLNRFLSFYLNNLPQNIKSNDESDAIAIAICHAQCMNNRMLNIAINK